MHKKNSGSNKFFKSSLLAIIFFCLAGVLIFKTGILHSGTGGESGLSGLVSVKGTVKIDDLGLSGNEVKRINRAVAGHKDMFTQVDLFLDAKSGRDAAKPTTVLVMAMVLETNGDCEVRSWSRKISRADLVPQLIKYMNRAAKEYEQFKQFPDVKQNFKCLYI